MWAITAEYWDKCVSKVMKEAYEYMIFDGVITLPEENSSDVNEDESQSEVILSIENNTETTLLSTETTQISTISNDHSYSSDRSVLKNQIIKECTVDLISPPKLAKIHGVSQSTIKRWVRRSGKDLPSRYQQQLKKNEGVPKNADVQLVSIPNSATESLTKQLLANLKSKWPSLNASVTEVEQSSPNTKIAQEVMLDPQPSTSRKKLALSLKCPKCDFTTFQKNYLEKHVQAHKNCEHCGKDFHGKDVKRQLAVHMKSHQPTARTVCDFCKNSYSKPANLKRHEKTCSKKNEFLQ